MGFSLQTVLNAVLATNILIACMTMVFKNTSVMLRLGYKILGLGTFLIMLRLFFPVEFTFTQNVCLPKFLSYTIVFIRKPRVGIFSIWHLLLAIWILGIFYHLYIYGNDYQKLKRFITANGTDVTQTDKYRLLLESICHDTEKFSGISIYETKEIYSPMICGIIHPKILIPIFFPFSDDDLKRVLKHELSHFFHHDLLLKVIVQLICIIYWWNPVCKTFQKQVNTILEIRVDHELTSSTQKEKADYFSCLLTIARHCTEESFRSPYIIYYCVNSHSVLHQRFEFGLNESFGKSYFFSLLFFAPLLSLYLFSHIFILEPFYATQEVENTTVGTTSDDCYYIQNTTGTYDIYFLDTYVETTDTLDYYYGIQPYKGGFNNNEKEH